MDYTWNVQEFTVRLKVFKDLRRLNQTVEGFITWLTDVPTMWPACRPRSRHSVATTVLDCVEFVVK